MQIFQGTNIDFIGKRNVALILSLALIAIGIVSILFHKGLNYGIDFAGGTLIQVKFVQPVTAEDVRKAVEDSRLGTYTIQQIGEAGSNEFIIRLPRPVEKEVEQTPSVIVARDLEEAFGKDNFDIRRAESVGPTMGEELKRSAMGSIAGALVMILLYITFRFEFRFALGAIIALIHDVLITVGAFSITNREFNLPVIAALLTIVGYSLNDTIVIFDRIRENQRLLHRNAFIDVINRSINQTLSRTMLTSLTTLIVVVCLFIFGGEVINDFAFALLIGIIVGTYSSIFVASPILVWWSNLTGLFQSGDRKRG
ncbi:protein translocase subunit SecF [bacterium]|nr:protein translocase subunit SecF [candidate division CSSED10-310 bacterium]